MTVNSETNKVSYAGDDSTVSFSTVFTFDENAEVVVTLVVDATGAETEWVLGTEYTLDGAGDGVAGTITVDTTPVDYTPATGETLVVELKPAFTQATALPRGGTVSPKGTLEPMHDKRVRQLLRLKDLSDRSLKVPLSETTIGVIPALADRKGYMLAFDATTGDPIASSQTLATIEDAGAASAAAAAASADAAAASAAAAAVAALSQPFTFSDTTTMSEDPGTGILRFNNAAFASTTKVSINDTTSEGADIAGYIATWDDSTNTVKGTLSLRNTATPESFAIFNVTGLTVETGWTEVDVTHVDSGTAFADTNTLVIEFSAAGDTGASGAGSGDLVAASNLSDVANTATAFSNIKQAATTSATGVVEISTSAENLVGVATRTPTVAGVVEIINARIDMDVPSTPASATGTDAVAVGDAAVAAGNDSVALGPAAETVGANSVAVGLTKATAIGQYAFGSGHETTKGDSTFIRFVARGNTTTVTPVNLNPDGTGTNCMILPADTSWGFRITVTAREDATGDSFMEVFEGLIKRDGSNNTALVGAVSTARIAEDTGATTWSVAVTADDTLEALQVEATGEAVHTIRWVAVVDITAVTS